LRVYRWPRSKEEEGAYQYESYSSEGPREKERRGATSSVYMGRRIIEMKILAG